MRCSDDRIRTEIARLRHRASDALHARRTDVDVKGPRTRVRGAVLGEVVGEADDAKLLPARCIEDGRRLGLRDVAPRSGSFDTGPIEAVECVQECFG
jgi:hypothetical protein